MLVADSVVALARAFSCIDVGQNICASAKPECENLSVSYWTFEEGDAIGKEPTLGHGNLTQGCYCQRSRLSTYGRLS